MVYVLIDYCDNKHLELPYQINRDSIKYNDGLMRVIGSNNDNIHIGSKSIIFQIPFDLSGQIVTFIIWENSSSYHCNTGSNIYIKFISEVNPYQRFIEVCGSDNCQLECRIYDKLNKTFTSRHDGYRMIPTNKHLSSKHILIGEDLIVAVPTIGNQAFIARHSNRSTNHGHHKPMITPHLSFTQDQVNFLQISKYRDKIYFIFTESATEMINFHNTFHNAFIPKIIFTRLGRLCHNDQGIQLSELFFTSFIKTTFTCKLWLQKSRYSKKFIEYTQAIAASPAFGNSGNFFILFQSDRLTNTNFMYSSILCQYDFSSIEKQLENSKLAVLKENDSTKYWSLDMKRHNLSTCGNSFEYFSPNTEWMVANQLQSNGPTFIIQTNQTIGNPTAFEVMKDLPVTIIMPNNQTYYVDIDLIFIGTDKGILAKNMLFDKKLNDHLKVKDFPKSFNMNTILTFDHSTVVFDERLTITDIRLNTITQSIIITSDSIVKRIPLSFCSSSCRQCNDNIDPMCQWNPHTKICEGKPLQRGRQIIRVYKCQSDQAYRSVNMLKEKTIDLFWLIFSLVTFFCVFIVVLTVSIAVRYSPGSFPRSRRNANSTIYQVIHNKDAEKSMKKPKINHNSISSSLSESNSSKRNRFKNSLPNKNSKSFNSAKDSLIFENKFYLSSGKPKYPIDKTKHFNNKGKQRIKTQFCSITRDSLNLTSWKSCEAIFQLST